MKPENLEERADRLFRRIYDMDPKTHPELRKTMAWSLVRADVAVSDFRDALAKAVADTAADVREVARRLRDFAGGVR